MSVAASHHAELVQRIAGLLARPQAQLHPSWQAALQPAHGAWPSESPGPRLGVALFMRLCGPLPSLTVFDHAPARWCLLPREQRLARLAALALAAHPGVVRSCLRRAPRQALEAVLGPAYDALLERGSSAAAVPPQVAERPPEAWALDGYRALVRARLWPERSLRRWARLGLPRDADAGTAPPRAAVASAQQLQDVDAWFAA